MTANIDLVHPELRRAYKVTPRLSFNRRNLKLLRFFIRFQPTLKAPGDVRVENVYILSGDSRHKIRLRIYKPAALNSHAPALLWMHGGGLIIGRPEMDDEMMFQFVRELGIVIVSVDYRLAPDHPFPIPLDDCYTSLKWVSAQGASIGVDSSRIAVGGGSAGGGLAAALAQLACDRGEIISPVFQLLVYPMLDDRSTVRSLEHPEMMIWTQENNRFGWESYLQQNCGSEVAPLYSVPARREDLAGLPPAWIGVGTLDLFCEEDQAYAQQLKHCGVDCEILVIPGAYHGFDYFGSSNVVAGFRKSQIDALKRHLFS